MRLKGNLPFMKEINRRLILDTIRRKGSLSRADLAKETQLNPSTVTRITAELINEGFIREVGYADSQGGRKPILLNLVADAVHIIGINVETTEVIGVVSNLIGEVLYKITCPIKDTSKDGILQVITQTIQQLLDAANNDGRSIVGIGLAMHGLVDCDNGIALYPPAFGWKNLAIVSLLEEKFRIPVQLENNARAMALGEWWFGAGKALSNFIAVKVGHGIGSGIFLNGEIFRGINFVAGELGHTTLLVDGPLCDCGNYGCLEALASTKALVKRAQRSLKEGVESQILTLAGSPEQVEPEHIFKAADNQDPLAIQLLQDMGRYLGIALANLVNLLNPTKIILGGDILPGLEHILPILQTTVHSRAMEIPAHKLIIEPIKLGVNAVSIGAVSLILEEFFSTKRPNLKKDLSIWKEKQT